MTKFIYKSQKMYQEDINDLVEEELQKGRGPDKQPRKRRQSKLNTVIDEIHAYHKEHSTPETQESMKRYLRTEGIHPDQLTARAYTELRSMKLRPSIKNKKD